MNASPQTEVETERLVTWLVATFEVENDITLDAPALERLHVEATRVHAAWSLRRSDLALVNLPFLIVTPSGPVHFAKRISGQQLAAIFDGTEPTPNSAEGRARRAEEAKQARENATHQANTREEDARATKYFLIGLVVLLGLFLTAILEFSHHKHEADQDHKKEMRH